MRRSKFDNGLVRLYQSDARELPLKDGTVHCCVTSPPYFGLRVYQTDDDRVLGLESSIEEYIANLVNVFREVKRVLREDGVCWINMGDSYSGSGKGLMGDGTHAARPNDKQRTSKGTLNLTGGLQKNSDEVSGGNLLGVPWRVALALQHDGWILRDSIVWAKSSPMPESLAGWRWEQCRVKVGKGDGRLNPGHLQSDVSGLHHPGWREDESPKVGWTDCPGCAKCEANDGLVLRKGSWRCTSSYEHIFMLVKSMNYWADGEAVKTAQTGNAHPRGYGDSPKGKDSNGGIDRQNSSFHVATSKRVDVGGANRRNVWRDIHAEPYPGEHYATFPPDLPRICIQASTSEMGCCPKCGAQVTRVVDYQSHYKQREPSHVPHNAPTKVDSTGWEQPTNDTIGWRPCCGHKEAVERPEPCLVLDPFMGTGTTGLAAMRLNRCCVGTDLSEEYIKQARARLSEQSLPLPLMGSML